MLIFTKLSVIGNVEGAILFFFLIVLTFYLTFYFILYLLYFYYLTFYPFTLLIPFCTVDSPLPRFLGCSCSSQQAKD